MVPQLDHNRDNGIYDTLPWQEWTVGDPFFAKRDCFERFSGRDYPGASLTPQVSALFDSGIRVK